MVTSSPARIAANRRNALKSTGPRSAEGKRKVSGNAITHGVFCQDSTLLVSGEDAEQLRALRQGLIRDLRPQNIAALAVVERLTIALWKLRRLQAAEMQLHADAERTLRYKIMCRLIDGSPRVKQKDAETQAEQAKLPEGQTLNALLTTGAFSRQERYEQRLDNQIHRYLRDLEHLQKRREQVEELPPSPWDEEAADEAAHASVPDDEITQSSPAAPAPEPSDEQTPIANMRNKANEPATVETHPDTELPAQPSTPPNAPLAEPSSPVDESNMRNKANEEEMDAIPAPPLIRPNGACGAVTGTPGEPGGATLASSDRIV